jgi:FMN reductase (NADPH)
MTVAAIVPAAGKGTRMGTDKALVDLGGQSAIGRVVEQCLGGGVDEILVVRSRSADALPALPDRVRAVEVDGKGEMADSLREALARLTDGVDRVVVFPVDHALVMADTVGAVHGALLRPGAGIALPLFRDRVGHPAAFRRSVIEELRASAPTLRDVVRANRDRVIAVPTSNPWVLADLDRPEDLRAARAALTGEPWPVLEQMHRHRSRRTYLPEPLARGQLERLVDAARRASTSSFIQAYAVLAVQDAARKEKVAELCGDQEHIRQAPVFLAICADLHKLALACGRHGQTLRTDSLELFLQAAIDAALVGQNLQLAAESEGLGACMIGGARNRPEELAALLGLPRHCFCVFGLTLGRAADDPLERDRMPLSGILHRETYDVAAAEAAVDGADEAMRAWARRINAERGGYQGRPVDERKGWTDRMAAAMGERSRYLDQRASLRAELDRLGFGLQ